jgi:glycosyltransferase involved in cell wall biosynthesis
MGSEDYQTRFLFLSLYNPDYSRSAVIFSGLPKASFDQIRGNLVAKVTNIWKAIRTNPDISVIVIMSPSHYLTIIARLVTRKHVILDAGWPLSDSSRLRSHGIQGRISLIKNYCLDLLSFHAAQIVIVESEAQKRRTQHNYFLKEKKLHVIYTGLDEKKYAQQLGVVTNIDVDIREIVKSKKQLVLFRGKNNPESGLELLAQASCSISSSIQLVVISSNLPKNIVFDNSAIVVSRFINDGELKEIYESSVLTIGQLGNTPRQQWTLPHKFFESAFFGVAYLSKHTKAIAEITKIPSDLLVAEDIQAKELAEKINALVANKDKLDSASESLLKDFRKIASQEMAIQSFLRISQGLLP